MHPAKRFDYTPILGWSVSRHDVFSICRRRYYYTYYSKYDPDLSQDEIGAFRRLISVPLETGAVVHDVIRALLSRLTRSADPVDHDKLREFARRTARNHLASGVFEEVVYGERPMVGLDDLFPKVETSLDNLLASDRLRWITTLAMASRSEWLIDPPGYGETRIGDLKLYCKVDFLFPVDGLYHILDWKTGQPDPHKHRRQLIGYASWASYHYDTVPERVRPAIAYLHPSYSEVEEAFNEFDLESFAIQVRAETQEMVEFCRDVELNIPLEKDRFPLVDNQRICSYCRFRGICYPERYPYHFPSQGPPPDDPPEPA